MAVDTATHAPSTTASPGARTTVRGIRESNPRYRARSVLCRRCFAPRTSRAASARCRSSPIFCGLPLERLTALRPERLALHEVLIRVMADLTVPDGQKYEDLGVNFRQMTAAIMDKHIAPKMSEIDAVFENGARARGGPLHRPGAGVRTGRLPPRLAGRLRLPGSARWARMIRSERRAPRSNQRPAPRRTRTSPTSPIGAQSKRSGNPSNGRATTRW